MAGRRRWGGHKTPEPVFIRAQGDPDGDAIARDAIRELLDPEGCGEDYG